MPDAPAQVADGGDVRRREGGGQAPQGGSVNVTCVPLGRASDVRSSRIKVQFCVERSEHVCRDIHRVTEELLLTINYELRLYLYVVKRNS